MQRVGERQAARERPAVHGGELAGVQHTRDHMGLGDAQLDPPARERWVDGVVVAIDAEIRLLRHPHHGPTVAVRQSIRQRPHPRPLDQQPLSRNGTDRAMHTPVDPVTPVVKLDLEIDVVREPTARKEVRAHKPVRALKDPLCLRIGRLQDPQPTLSCPQNATNSVVGRP